METIKLPRTIDDPPVFLVWRADDLMVPAVMLIVGLFVDRMILFFVIGVALSFVYRKFREGRPEQFVLHSLYWSGLWPNRGHSFVNPFKREFRP